MLCWGENYAPFIPFPLNMIKMLLPIFRTKSSSNLFCVGNFTIWQHWGRDGVGRGVKKQCCQGQIFWTSKYKRSAHKILCSKRNLRSNYYTGGPLCKQHLYPGFTLFRCILSLIQVYIFEIYVQFWLFWYPYSPHCEKKFVPLFSCMYCMTPTRYDLRA
jgi:hypothetical protein